MSSELVLRPSDVPANFQQQMEMARAYAGSSLLPGHLRGKPENVLIILSAARALDVPAFWAFQSLFVVSGKLGMEATLMRALVIRAGHQFETREMSRDKATVAIKRSDKSSWFEVSFDMADAKTAKLAGDNWTKYPRSMLHARATVMAIRAECPEVLYGVMYTPEELGAKVDEEGHPVLETNGAVILDSTAEEILPMDSETYLRVVNDLQCPDLTAAANAYLLAKNLKSSIDEERFQGLTEMWTNRIFTETYAEDVTVEHARNLWKLAHGTGLLDYMVFDGKNLVSLNDSIRARVTELSAYPAVEEIVDGDGKPATS